MNFNLIFWQSLKMLSLFTDCSSYPKWVYFVNYSALLSISPWLYSNYQRLYHLLQNCYQYFSEVKKVPNNTNTRQTQTLFFSSKNFHTIQTLHKWLVCLCTIDTKQEIQNWYKPCFLIRKLAKNYWKSIDTKSKSWFTERITFNLHHKA